MSSQSNHDFITWDRCVEYIYLLDHGVRKQQFSNVDDKSQTSPWGTCSHFNVNSSNTRRGQDSGRYTRIKVKPMALVTP